jgi:hypothetical protein
VIVLLEVSLSQRPYRLRRISLLPSLVTAGIVLGFFGALFIIVNAPAPYDRFGIYLSSDPVLEVFVLMSLTLFFTSPILIGSQQPSDGNASRQGHGQRDTIKTNK